MMPRPRWRTEGRGDGSPVVVRHRATIVTPDRSNGVLDRLRNTRSASIAVVRTTLNAWRGTRSPSRSMASAAG